MKMKSNGLVLERKEKDRQHPYYRNGLRSIHVSQIVHTKLTQASTDTGYSIKDLVERFITYGLTHSRVK